ncbi:hypothetical protein H9P43_000830 [Blastocladiella emersonii ATCC 22665]|nr:hypothetical protein H9P43_000830 [Blastocladiella emersonii ATCC 22665]
MIHTLALAVPRLMTVVLLWSRAAPPPLPSRQPTAAATIPPRTLWLSASALLELAACFAGLADPAAGAAAAVIHAALFVAVHGTWYLSTLAPAPPTPAGGGGVYLLRSASSYGDLVSLPSTLSLATSTSTSSCASSTTASTAQLARLLSASDPDLEPPPDPDLRLRRRRQVLLAAADPALAATEDPQPPLVVVRPRGGKPAKAIQEQQPAPLRRARTLPPALMMVAGGDVAAGGGLLDTPRGVGVGVPLRAGTRTASVDDGSRMTAAGATTMTTAPSRRVSLLQQHHRSYSDSSAMPASPSAIPASPSAAGSPTPTAASVGGFVWRVEDGDDDEAHEGGRGVGGGIPESNSVYFSLSDLTNTVEASPSTPTPPSPSPPPVVIEPFKYIPRAVVTKPKRAAAAHRVLEIAVQAPSEYALHEDPSAPSPADHCGGDGVELTTAAPTLVPVRIPGRRAVIVRAQVPG